MACTRVAMCCVSVHIVCDVSLFQGLPDGIPEAERGETPESAERRDGKTQGRKTFTERGSEWTFEKNT